MGANPSKACASDDGGSFVYNNASVADADELPNLAREHLNPKDVRFIHQQNAAVWRTIEKEFDKLGVELEKGGNKIDAFENFLRGIFKEREKISKTEFSKLDTSVLREVFNEFDAETNKQFLSAMPKLQSLAKQIPIHINRLSLLNQSDKDGTTVVLSKAGCASLLINAFCGSVLDPPVYCGSHSSHFHPKFNFYKWFSDLQCKPYLKALLNYFIRIGNESNEVLERKVAFRRSLGINITVEKAQKELKQVTTFSKEEIEESSASLHADFANKLIGGPVLEGGRAQEQILFCMRPELFCMIAFCAALKPDEAVVVRGAERYSSFKGSGTELEFAGNYVDTTPCDSYGYLQREIACYDAVFTKGTDYNQFTESSIRRDIVKSYTAFKFSTIIEQNTYQSITVPEIRGDVATGNWGCGVFGGHKELKFLEQYIAASMASRNIQYYTRDSKFSECINEFVTGLKTKKFYANDLFKAVCECCKGLPPTTPTNFDLFGSVLAYLDRNPQPSNS